MLFSRLGKVAQALAHSARGSGDSGTPVAPGADVALGEDLTVGDLVLEWLVKCYGRENGGETINRCERLLQVLAPGGDGLSDWRLVILTTSTVAAMTAPGRAVYVTEGLLHLIGAGDDAPLAFVLAHEIAHHLLGHVATTIPGRWREWLGEAAGFPSLAATTINRLLFSAEQEYAADREALALCRRAGFDLTHCLTLFDRLSCWEAEGRRLGEHFSGDWIGAGTPFQAWLRERVGGYPTLAARQAAAEGADSPWSVCKSVGSSETVK